MSEENRMKRICVIPFGAAQEGMIAPLLLFDRVTIVSHYLSIEDPAELFGRPSEPYVIVGVLGEVIDDLIRSTVDPDYQPSDEQTISAVDPEKFMSFMNDINYLREREVVDISIHRYDVRNWSQLVYLRATGKLKLASDEELIASALHSVEAGVLACYAHNQRLVEVPNATKEDVVQFVLKSLPIPRNSVPLDEILDFRQDNDNQAKLWSLRRWMSNMGRKEVSMTEVEEEFFDTLNDYKRQLQLLDSKATSINLVFVISVLPQFIANLLAFKPSEAFSQLAQWRNARLGMSESELELRGKELSYIKAVEDAFSKYKINEVEE